MRWLRVAWKTLLPPKPLCGPNAVPGIAIYLFIVENTIFPCRPKSARSDGSCKMQGCFLSSLRELQPEVESRSSPWASPLCFLVRWEHPFIFQTITQSTSREQKPLSGLQSLEGDHWHNWTTGKTIILRHTFHPGGKTSTWHCSVTSADCGDHLMRIYPRSKRVGFTGTHLVWQKARKSLEFTSQKCSNLPLSASPHASSSHHQILQSMAWNYIGRTEQTCPLWPGILNATSHHHCTALLLPQVPPHFFLTGLRLFCLVDRLEYFLMFFLINTPALRWNTERFPFISLAISPAVTWTHDRWQVLNGSVLPVHSPVVVISHMWMAVASFVVSHAYL